MNALVGKWIIKQRMNALKLSLIRQRAKFKLIRTDFRTRIMKSADLNKKALLFFLSFRYIIFVLHEDICPNVDLECRYTCQR